MVCLGQRRYRRSWKKTRFAFEGMDPLTVVTLPVGRSKNGRFGVARFLGCWPHCRRTSRPNYHARIGGCVGNRATNTLENGTRVEYLYDDASRMTSMTHKTNGTSFASFAHGSNSVDNRTNRVETNNAEAESSPVKPKQGESR